MKDLINVEHKDGLFSSTKSTEERFHEKYILNESGCWLWQGSIAPNGYGKLSVNNSPESAHRISYEIYKSKIEKGMHIDHLCRVRNCVNPDHLEMVTPGENFARGNHRNKMKTHCPQGHPYSGNNLRMRKLPSGRYSRVCRICANKPKKQALANTGTNKE